MLTRFPLKVSKPHRLHCRFGNESRKAPAMHVVPDNGLPEFLLIGTHLCHQSTDTEVVCTILLRQTGSFKMDF